MDALYVVNDTVAITMFLLIAAGFAVSAPTRAIAWLIALICFSYIAYLLSARQDYAYYIPAELQLSFGAVYPLLNIARNSISALFLLLSHFLFRDEQQFPRPLAALIALQLILEEPVGWFVSGAWEAANPFWMFLIYEGIPACLQMFFLLVASYWVIMELHLDLIRRRRVARIFMLCVVVGQGLMSLLIERIGFMGGLVPSWAMYPVHHALVAVQAAVGTAIVISLLRRDLLEFLVREPESDAQQAAERLAEDRAVARLQALLEEERVYQQMGLTVADLAKRAGIPQYRLRDLIHNELGFRNFNAFLHHYRIAEVAAALEDEAQDQVPILTLALTAGYQSINPFNRAFKELKGVTPSEYRSRRSG